MTNNINTLMKTSGFRFDSLSGAYVRPPSIEDQRDSEIRELKSIMTTLISRICYLESVLKIQDTFVKTQTFEQ